MFNVGDVVRAIKDPYGEEYYGITDSTITCEVVAIEGHNLLVRPTGYSTVFTVRSERFRLEHFELENK